MLSPGLPGLTLLQRGRHPPQLLGTLVTPTLSTAHHPEGPASRRGRASPLFLLKGSWQQNGGQGWNIQGTNFPSLWVSIYTLSLSPQGGRKQ